MRRGAKAAVWVLGVIVLLAALAVGAYFGGKWLWGELAAYIRPDNATERKDLINVFVLIGAGIVGSLTALAAIVNASISRGNLQHAREALREQGEREEQRAQDDALQAYFQQMGELLTDHSLNEAQPESAVSLLARAQTFTVLSRVDARRKRDLLRFLYRAGLIRKAKAVVQLVRADLNGTDLSREDLRGADLSGAYLSDAEGWTEQQLKKAQFLTGATMPDGQVLKSDDKPDRPTLEAWLKSRGAVGKNSGP